MSNQANIRETLLADYPVLAGLAAKPHSSYIEWRRILMERDWDAALFTSERGNQIRKSRKVAFRSNPQKILVSCCITQPAPPGAAGASRRRAGSYYTKSELFSNRRSAERGKIRSYSNSLKR